eukprot:CAMPEP_0116859128 /NCGR_PEP_ID=MMETSP0418-20121206/21607_1 /TAXON_ID=1158023 /ORGANISM="Astrosyne radiata, Strain 13vi08-1A" /LENGTH=128 /DNA_ID=CAMNT_0004493229 /DNA_START=12 /DNA_END=398 /DNA_ORIENTATION=-
MSVHTGKNDRASKTGDIPVMPFGKLVDDCERPSCEDTVSALSAAMNRIQANSTTTTTTSSKPECPPRSAELGRSTWTFLHSMAAWYPEKPTHQEKKLMTNFMSALARFYPCPWCARDFQKNLGEKPAE